MSNLPAPPVPSGINLRDVPIPREFFARMAVEQFGIDYETARQFADAAADRIEGISRQVRRRRDKLRRDAR